MGASISERELDEHCVNLLFAKIGWCENYDGGEDPKGNYGWLKDHCDGWERYNFKAVDGAWCYGYLIPSGGWNLPAVEPRSGWTIIFVAPLEGRGSLYPVGFYLNTTIESAYFDRPEYDTHPMFPLDAKGNKYGYCLSCEAKDAYQIRPMSRGSLYPRVPGDRFGTAPFRYGSKTGDRFSREYYRLGREIVDLGLRLEWPLRP